MFDFMEDVIDVVRENPVKAVCVVALTVAGGILAGLAQRCWLRAQRDSWEQRQQQGQPSAPTPLARH